MISLRQDGPFRGLMLLAALVTSLAMLPGRAAAEVVLDEAWAGQQVGATGGQLQGWTVAYGDADAVTVQAAEGKRSLVFAANAPNTAVVTARRWPLGADGSISASATLQFLPTRGGPAGVNFRGYDAQGQRIESYWFLYDPGQRAVLIKRGNANLAKVELPQIREALGEATWSAGEPNVYRLDVRFVDGGAALTLCINGTQIADVRDDEAPARFATTELLLFSFNGNDAAFDRVRLSTPAPAPCRTSAAAAAVEVEEPIAGDSPEAAARRAQARLMRRQYAGQGQTLNLHSLSASAESAPLYQRVEWSFQLDGPYTNPFDADDVRVDARITRPDGSTITVPAFFMHPHESKDGRTRLEANVTYRPTGEPSWRLRYAPTQVGPHRVQLVATLGATNQTVESPATTFEATPSDHPGYVRISPDNPLYFEREADRSLFFATGSNIAWTRTRQRSPYTGEPEKDYEHYFARAAGNASATRVWQCHYAWIEWTPVPGEPADIIWSGYGGLHYYNQMVAAAFDRVFELAEEANVPLMLVLDDNDEHDRVDRRHAWVHNPYNVINGGPCVRPQDVFTEPEARRAYRNRVRYVMARWGYSPALWTINSWNDRVGTPAYVVPWLREIRDYLHELTGDWRPVIYGTNFRFEAQAISDYAQAERGALVPGKPNVIQESYFTLNHDWFIDTLREEVWTTLGRGRGGVLVWPHSLVDHLDAWPVFRAVTDFLEEIPLNRHTFRPADARVVSASVSRQGAMRALALAPYGDVPIWGARATQKRFPIDVRSGSQFLEGMARKFYGQRTERLPWRTEPTFIFDLPGEGSMIIEVGELSGSGMRLVARDHGRELVNIPLDGEGRRRPTRDQRHLRIPLDAGARELSISLEGPASDWLEIRKLMIVYQEPQAQNVLDLYGLASDRHAMLYLRNSTHGELQQTLLDQTFVTVEDVQIQVRGLAGGAYRVSLFDVEQGRFIHEQNVTADRSGLSFAIPRVERQAAVRITPR